MKKTLFFICISIIAIISSCARMGSPDGGWYDEQPPRIVKTTPENGGTNINDTKIVIYFDEFVKIENPTENVIISPPQIEQADIKGRGKNILVSLKDSLKENTTYTIDFSNSITDNNENNPLGNYTFYFSTGDEIDTLQVSGYIIDASNNEAMSGILVGLYMIDEENDSTKHGRFMKDPMLRVSRTDADGHFTIKGVKEGKYRIYALKDMDNNFMFTPQSGEMMAFNDEVLIPSVFDDYRQDTTMLDSLRIKSIERIKYRHFVPDDVVLRAFNEVRTDRMFVNAERSEADHFLLKFSYGDKELPKLRGLNFDAENAFVIDTDNKNDSITYWIKDTTLVNTDSLEVEMIYNMTDSLGTLVSQTDTLMLIPKVSYEKRMKNKNKEYEEWFKKEQKKKKKGEKYDSIMAPKPLELKYSLKGNINPDDSIMIEIKTPIERIDTAKINLYIKEDTILTKVDYLIENKRDINIRTFKIIADWEPEAKYVLELDSAAFVDIYGTWSKAEKKDINVKGPNNYGSLKIKLSGIGEETVIYQLMDSSDKVISSVSSDKGSVLFSYVDEKDYYLRIIVDRNKNGIWDTGNFAEELQPEEVYYYPEAIKCKAKWDITKEWNPLSVALYKQKPMSLRKQKNTKKVTSTRSRNEQRAREMGISLPSSK